MRSRPARILVVALLAAAGCSAPAATDDEGGGTAVRAVMTNASVSLDPPRAPSGPVTFVVENAGTVTHELEIFSSDLAPEALPVVDNIVQGDMQPLDEVENVEPSASAEFTVTLDPGAYVLICNMPGHYSQGMRAGFTVS
jgi:hypothetical protein